MCARFTDGGVRWWWWWGVGGKASELRFQTCCLKIESVQQKKAKSKNTEAGL